MKQDISLQCPRLLGNLRCLERREEAQITEHHQHEVFLFSFVWQVYDWCFHRSFRHTLRTLIKRVISICAGLKVDFNQVKPLEVWTGRGGKGKEINWAVDQGQLWKKLNTGGTKPRHSYSESYSWSHFFFSEFFIGSLFLGFSDLTQLSFTNVWTPVLIIFVQCDLLPSLPMSILLKDVLS